MCKRGKLEISAPFEAASTQIEDIEAEQSHYERTYFSLITLESFPKQCCDYIIHKTSAN